MKKLLLTTTAAILFAGVANAESPTITVGGHADVQFGFTDQEDAANIDAFTRDYHTRNDTELFFNVDGETDGGIQYGAYIELEADVNLNDNAVTGDGNSGINAERTYLYLGMDNIGRVEVGATGDAGDRLRVDAARFNSNTLASATGGIGGDFNRFVGITGNYYVLPGLPTAAGLPGEANGTLGIVSNEARATANKISYYSPRIAGFQLGASYTVDQAERGTSVGFSGTDDGSIENAINAGINYEGEYDLGGNAPLVIAASLTGEIGDAENAAQDDLQAYAAGLSASYMGLTLGGSYGLLDEVNAISTWDSEGSYWTAGAAYELGAFSTSVTYLSSEIENANALGDDAEFQNLSVGADYAIAPGLMPYVEVNFFEAEGDTTGVDNDGTIFILGTQLTF